MLIKYLYHSLYFSFYTCFKFISFNKENAAIKSTVLLTAFLFFNLFMLIDGFCYFFNIPYLKIWNGSVIRNIIIVLFVLMLYVFNYMVFLNKNQFIELEHKYRSEKIIIKIIRIALVIAYIFITTILTYYFLGVIRSTG